MKQAHDHVDDDGNKIWLCHYTNQALKENEVTWIGSLLPQCNTAIAVGGEGWKKLWRHERACYAEMDRNCNACACLIKREILPRNEQIAGLAAGICASPVREKTPYPMRGDCIVFAPQDWMGMGCFVNRYEKDFITE